MATSTSRPVALSPPEPTFDSVHALALRSDASPLPPGGEALLSRGLAEPAGAGFLLTSDGYRLHRTLLDQERSTIDIASFGMAYAPIAALSRQLGQLRMRWQETPSDRPELMASFQSFVTLAQTPLGRASAIVPRFDGYLPRLLAAARHLRDGDLRFAVDTEVDSIALTWDDLHEDYLQTLGRGHDMEEL